MKQMSNPESDQQTANDLQIRIEQMYVRTEHWISDFAFFEDEMRFLINLMDRFFISLLVNDTARVEMIKTTAKKLVDLDNRREEIAGEVRENLEYLAHILKNETSFDPEEFKDSQCDLEVDHTEFLKSYKALKKEIFDLAEHLSKLSKAGYLLKND